MAQEGYQFAQSLMVVPRGATVAIPNNDNDYHDIYFIMRIVGSDVPMLRIKSPNNNYSYLIGTVSVDCVPSGYYDYNICTTPAL